eukprot:35139-Chlamydomonas_euryale.AAC.7
MLASSRHPSPPPPPLTPLPTHKTRRARRAGGGLEGSAAVHEIRRGLAVTGCFEAAWDDAEQKLLVSPAGGKGARSPRDGAARHAHARTRGRMRQLSNPLSPSADFTFKEPRRQVYAAFPTSYIPSYFPGADSKYMQHGPTSAAGSAACTEPPVKPLALPAHVRAPKLAILDAAEAAKPAAAVPVDAGTGLARPVPGLQMQAMLSGHASLSSTERNVPAGKARTSRGYGMTVPTIVRGTLAAANSAVRLATPVLRLATPKVNDMVLDDTVSIASGASIASGPSVRSPRPLNQAAPVGMISAGRASHKGIAGFQPSRADALLVFKDMDPGGTGRITRSDLEGACIAMGYAAASAHAIFSQIDRDAKGYINTADWGAPSLAAMVRQLSLAYMQKFFGLPDKTASEDAIVQYLRKQQDRMVTSLPAAVRLVRTNAQRLGGTSDVIFEAFRFVDMSGSGRLGREQMQEGFAALGVNISDSVGEHLMRAFDAQKTGTVDYSTFVNTLFA